MYGRLCLSVDVFELSDKLGGRRWWLLVDMTMTG